MSVQSRLKALERQAGDPRAPRSVIITTHQDCHGIWTRRRDLISLSIPWRDDHEHNTIEDVIGELTDEQRALIRPQDKVVAICLPPNGRDDITDIGM